MENKKDFKVSELAKQTLYALAENVILKAHDKVGDSLSAANFYQSLYEPKIQDLELQLEEVRPAIKKCKDKKVKDLYQTAFDTIMSVHSARSERDIVSRILYSNTCLQDALYLLRTSKVKK